MNTHDGYKKQTLDNTLVLLAGGGHKPLSDFALSGDYVYRAGDTMTGILHMLANQYTDSANTGALDLSNSDIYGVNSIKFSDLSDAPAEGLQWYRDSTHVDTFWVKSGVMYFTPNRAWGATGTSYTVLHTGNIGLYAGGSGNITANTAQTNGSVYLTLRAGASYFKHNIVGATGISVTSDANGKITITGTEYSTTSHTHAFAQITNKITQSNEFNFLDSEAAQIWFNYRTANDSAATTAISTYHFGSALSDGTYASVKSAGFVKNGSDDTYILLGGGGHTLLSGLASTHTHPYLPLAGGAMNDQAVITRTGESVTWVNGRKYPLIKTTSYTGYNSILSMKTTSGSWDLGVYTNDIVYLTYITDTNYNNGTNTTTYQMQFPKKSGTIALTSDLSGYLTGQDHYKTSPGAGTAGTSSATSGSTLAVPYLTINANGHITGYGTHTHTVTGFLPGVWTASWGGSGGEQYTFGENGLRIQQIQDESSGIQLNGDCINMWAPCDSYCIRFWDEDGGTEMWNINEDCLFSGYIDWTHVLNAPSFAASSHSHTLSIATTTDTNQITLAANTKYKLTAGGSTYVFTTPPDQTGTGGDGNTQYYLTLNGTVKGTSGTTNLGSFYAPTSSGTSGQYLKSNGSGSAPTWATFDFASSSHSHTLSIATTTDSSSITLAANTKYKLTAGGSTYVFTTPPDATGGTSGDYLPLAGGTMTGAGSIVFNSFETSSKRWFYGGTRNAGWKYDYGGNEALIISAGSYSSAAISFYSGSRLALNDSSGQWSSTTADMQIKQNCVGIGANVNTSYKLYVAGSVAASGGFVHTSVASDDYVLLAGGGYTALSNLGGGGGGSLYYLTLNGTNKGDTSGTSLGSFYAPTSSGTSGQYLKSNGSGSAPTWTTLSFASSSHTHTLSIATTTDSSSITLAANTKYKLTAGGSTYVFTTPPAGSGGSVTDIWVDTTGDTMTGNLTMSNAWIITPANDSYGIRPATNNYGQVGSSSYYFYQGYINNMHSNGYSHTGCGSSNNYVLLGGGGYKALTDSTPFGEVVWVGTDGVMEIGRYIDWHYDNTTGSDYSCRLQVQGNNSNVINLPTGSGTLALTSDIPSGGGGSISISNYSSTFYPCGYTSYSGSNITALKAYSGFYVTSTGAYHTSDIRKKCDIQDIYDDEITKLFNTHHGYIHSFRWRDTDKPAFGFIAQELLEYCPEAVDYNIDTGFYTVNYEMALSKVVGVLFKKIKKQDSEIKKLRKLLENRK